MRSKSSGRSGNRVSGVRCQEWSGRFAPSGMVRDCHKLSCSGQGWAFGGSDGGEYWGEGGMEYKIEIRDRNMTAIFAKNPK